MTEKGRTGNGSVLFLVFPGIFTLLLQNLPKGAILNCVVAMKRRKHGNDQKSI